MQLDQRYFLIYILKELRERLLVLVWQYNNGRADVSEFSEIRQYLLVISGCRRAATTL